MSRRSALRAFAIVFALVLAVGHSRSLRADSSDALWFIHNVGQREPSVAYYVPGVTFGVDVKTDGDATLNVGGSAVGLGFDGSSAGAAQGVGHLTTANVLMANRPESPVRGAEVVESVVFPGLYPGIDLAYSGTFQTLVRKLTVGAGASPSPVRLRYLSGVPASEAVSAYQIENDARVDVSVARAAQPDGSYALNLGAYQTAAPLYVELRLAPSPGIDTQRESAVRETATDDEDGELYYTQPDSPGAGPSVSANKATVSDGAKKANAGAGARPDRKASLDALIVGSDLGGGDLVPGNGDVLSGTFTNVGTFHVQPGVVVFVDPGVPLVVEAAQIAIEGTVNADGAGGAGGSTNPSPGSPGLPGSGPGGGNGGDFGQCVHGNGGGGGGYGGPGGNSSHLFSSSPAATLGGPAYGAANPPGVLPGSGGGSAANFCDEVFGGPGGNGGGAVTLIGSVVTVVGTITADGSPGQLIGAPTRSGGGGGSGGGIWLDGCLTLDGATLSAAGGAGAGDPNGYGLAQGGGGGAGGRIKLSGSYAPSPTYSANVSGAPPGLGNILNGDVGGAPGTSGADGSAVDLTVDNGGACALAGAVGGIGVGAVGLTKNADEARVVTAGGSPSLWTLLLLALGGVLAVGSATVWVVRGRPHEGS